MKGLIFRIRFFLRLLKTLNLRVILRAFRVRKNLIYQKFLFYLSRKNLLDLYPDSKKIYKVLRVNSPQDLFEKLNSEGISYFFLASRNPEDIKKGIKAHTPEYLNHIVKVADEYIKDEYELLGSGKIKFNKGYPWHKDFKSNYEWDDKTFFSDVKFGSVKGVDVKVPWELSRMQMLPLLSIAYALTKEEKYAEKCVFLIEDWMEKNPPMRGVNWNCAMDVAIRTANFTFAFTNLLVYLKSRKELLLKFLKFHYLHLRHILLNLEVHNFITTNHYFSDLCGLIISSLPFKNFPFYRKILFFSLKEFEREVLSQFRKDGTNFESSSYYHCFVLEMAIYALMFLKRENFRLKKEVEERLKNALDYLSHLRAPNGNIVQIGDGDSGKFFIFSKRHKRNFDHILSLGSLIFEELKNEKIEDEVLLFFPEEGLKNLKEKSNSIKREFPVLFAEGGAGFYKDHDLYFVFVNPPQGTKGIGNHNHNDKLSFIVFYRGEEFFTDPGTFVYTPFPEWRNAFRSTLYHNTLSVEMKEQSRFEKRSLFFLRDLVKTGINMQKGESKIVFSGEHTGYKRLGITHRRQIEIYPEENKMLICDSLMVKKRKTYPVFLNFVLNPEVKISEVKENQVVVEQKNTKVFLNFEISGRVRIESIYYSPEYGIKVPTKKIVFHTSCAGDTKLISLIKFN